MKECFCVHPVLAMHGPMKDKLQPFKQNGLKTTLNVSNLHFATSTKLRVRFNRSVVVRTTDLRRFQITTLRTKAARSALVQRLRWALAFENIRVCRRSQVFFSRDIPDVFNNQQNTHTHTQSVSKRTTRFQITVSNNENVLQLQNKLQTIK